MGVMSSGNRRGGLFFLCGDSCFFNGGGFVFGLVGYGGWFLFCVFSFFRFSRVQDRRSWGSSEVYWWSFRYSFALLSNLKKSEASGVVRPVRMVLFLSGWYRRASCR